MVKFLALSVEILQRCAYNHTHKAEDIVTYTIANKYQIGKKLDVVPRREISRL